MGEACQRSGGAVMGSEGRGGGEEGIVPFVTRGVSDLLRAAHIILSSGKRKHWTSRLPSGVNREGLVHIFSLVLS